MDAAILSTHFDNLGLPPEAKEYLLDLWVVIQLLDDVADGDQSPDSAKVAWAIFARMPLNRFYQHNMMTLQPLLVMQIIKWEAASAAEAKGIADERSFMWRAGFWEIVAMACHLCGLDAHAALNLYGETFADYRKEFPHA
jgi:hypothetical protein